MKEWGKPERTMAEVADVLKARKGGRIYGREVKDKQIKKRGREKEKEGKKGKSKEKAYFQI